MKKRVNHHKETGMCPHGNFISSCKRCTAEKNPDTEMSEWREHAKEFAITYRGLVDYLSGSSESLPNTAFGTEDDRKRWESFTDGVKEGLRRQQEKLESQTGDKDALLADLLEKLNVSLTSEEMRQIEIKNHGRIPIVFIPQDLYYNKVRTREAAAFAYTPAESISLVVIPRSPELEYDERIVAENIPHETHHIGWKWAIRAGQVPNNEPGRFRKASFSMYQDEMMARAVSEGALFGYTHLKMLSPEESEKAKLGNEEDHKYVSEVVGELNELAKNILYALVERDTDMTKADVGLAVFRATNFADLRNDFEKIKTYLESFPIKPLADASGWGSVIS